MKSFRRRYAPGHVFFNGTGFCLISCHYQLLLSWWFPHCITGMQVQNNYMLLSVEEGGSKIIPHKFKQQARHEEHDTAEINFRSTWSLNSAKHQQGSRKVQLRKGERNETVHSIHSSNAISRHETQEKAAPCPALFISTHSLDRDRALAVFFVETTSFISRAHNFNCEHLNNRQCE